MTKQRVSTPDSQLGAPVAATCIVGTAYVGTILAANLASTHLPALTVGQLLVPAGTLFAGVTFTLRDVLHEAVGPRVLFAAIGLGTAMSWLAASPRIALASALAFALSETLDSTIYGLLRRRSRLRALLGSNVAGLLIDSLLFVPLAFGSFSAAPGQVVGKVVATLLSTAAVSRVRQQERVRW